MTGDFDDAKKRLINHLQNLIRLSNETKSLLLPQNTQNDHKTDLEQKIDDLNNLRIRMAILAPMKTGKSSILNAIIGDEILPIHDEAMTALPTEIILQYNVQPTETKPNLQLNATCQETLQEIHQLVLKALKDLPPEDQEKKLNWNSHLILTAQKMLEDKLTDHLVWEAIGSEEINKRLKNINDLVHIFMFLYSGNVPNDEKPSSTRLLHSFFQNIPNVKTVATGYNATSSAHDVSRPCQLLLVDTPGPNEETTSNWLQMAIEEEIKKSDIVLVALDYTALGTNAEAKIENEIRKVRSLKDPNYIYAVVNKIDQRQGNGKSSEDVKNHVASRYQISSEKVFELSARYALTARKFIALYNTSSNSESQLLAVSSVAAESVLRQFYPIDFKDRIGKANGTEIKELAAKLEKLSGIPELLESGITNISNQIIDRCIQSAFRAGYRICDELQKEVSSHHPNLNVLLKDLQKILQELHAGREQIDDIEKAFDSDNIIQSIQSKTNQKIHNIFTDAESSSFDATKKLFDETNKRWLDTDKWRGYFYAKRSTATIISVAGSVTGGIMAFTFPPTGIAMAVTGVVGLAVYYHSSGIIEFDKRGDAEKYIEHFVMKTNSICDSNYAWVTKKVNEECNCALKELQNVCKKKIDTIIENVRKRCNMYIELCPSIELPDAIDIQHPAPKSISIDCRYRPLFGYAPFTWSCERDTEKHKRFHISRQQLYQTCKTLIRDNMSRVQNEVKAGVARILEQTLTAELITFRELLLKGAADVQIWAEKETQNKRAAEELKQKLDILGKRLDYEKSRFHECETTFKALTSRH